MEHRPSSQASSSQLFKEFPEFYLTRMFITVFTTARHLSQSWARLIQSTPLIHFNNGLTHVQVFPQMSSSKSPPPHPLCTAVPLHHPRPNNNSQRGTKTHAAPQYAVFSRLLLPPSSYLPQRPILEHQASACVLSFLWQTKFHIHIKLNKNIWCNNWKCFALDRGCTAVGTVMFRTPCVRFVNAVLKVRVKVSCGKKRNVAPLMDKSALDGGKWSASSTGWIIHTYIHTYTHTYVRTYIHTHTYIHSMDP